MEQSGRKRRRIGAKPAHRKRLSRADYVACSRHSMTASPSTVARDALVERLFQAAVATFDLFGVYLGDRLGLYRALAVRGSSTASELAQAAGIHPRYAREWLEQQAATGILGVENQEEEPDRRRFFLPPGHEEVLIDEASLHFAASLAQSAIACARPIDALVAAFKSGEGLTFDGYGPDAHQSQARSTRPMFERLLGSEWLPSIPELHERLSADPPARVADVACGCGWSSISLARAYPKVSVEGIDLDQASIDEARRNLAGSDVQDRVRFHCRDAADAAFAERFDLVTIFEALHDMPRPVAVLRTIRAMLTDTGLVFVGDERTEDSFTAPAPDRERLYYGFSIMTCLPSGMVGPNPAGTGTVMRSDTLRHYATEAGFTRFDVLPIANDSWRFYLLAE
jgi:Methyltransferase domain/Rv2258c-like winged HTH domain